MQKRLGNAISGTELKNLAEKMLLSTPDICGLNNSHSRNSGPTFDTVSNKTGTDFL